MKYKIGLLLLLCVQSCFSFGLDDIESIFSLTETAVSTIVKVPEIAEFVDKPNTDGEVKIPFSKSQRQLVPMFKKFAEITRIMKDIENQMVANNIQTISTLRQSLPIAFRFELRLDSIEDAITMIDLYFQNFEAYSDIASSQLKNEPEAINDIIPASSTTQRSHFSANFKFERFTLENFAISLTSHEPTSVRGLMDRLNELMVPSSKESVRLFMRDGIFNTVLKSFDELDSAICSTDMSPQQLIYNLYSTLQATQLKGYVMVQFAWMLLHTYGKGNFTTETELLESQFKSRLVQQMATVMKAMQHADNTVYKCDPKVHIEGQSFTQLTELLQGYLVNEVDLNNKESCTESCSAYKYTEQYSCFKNLFCGRQPLCEGKIINCKYYDSDMTLCAAERYTTNSSRRYDWIQYENGKVLGRKGHCQQFEDKVDSWWRWLVYHCSYCMCLCDGRNSLSSDRYFSLRPAEADIEQNKIIVGLRFVKLNKVIHLQIRQATLLSKLDIDANSAEWVPVLAFKVTDFKIVQGLDYHKMSFESRALDLDDLKLPELHVLTGVRLRMLGKHLNLEVKSTPFDYESGKLDTRKSNWFGNDNTDASAFPRKFLDLENRDIPNLAHSSSTIDSNHDSYLLFTNSDFDRDIAQTTIPFIDIQSVSPDPLTPLSGAGLYHKGSPGYGGFVAPKIFTYDPSQFLSSEFLMKDQK